MPYVRCDECGKSAYSGALHSGRDTCPFCGAPIDVSRGSRNEESRPVSSDGSSEQRQQLQRVDDVAPVDDRANEQA